MTLAVRLNRRNKTALFLTLLAAGTSLMWGAGTKQTIGIVLLGVAFAWAFGSESRAVHWLFVVLGMALLAYSARFYSTARLDVPQHTLLGYTATVNGETVKWDFDNEKWIPTTTRNDPPFSLVMNYFWLDTWWIVVPGLLLLCAGIGLILGVKLHARWRLHDETR